MMLRKTSSTRPSLSRVISLLTTIISQPAAIQHSAANILATAGAQVAEREQAEQAAEQARKTLVQNRKQLLNHGFDVLRQSAEELWEKISAAAPAAVRGRNDRQRFTCTLGQGSLVINFANSANVVSEELLPHSKWDMVGASQLLVTQQGSEFSWPSTLWFGKKPGTDDYRWYEIVFWGSYTGRGLIEVTNLKDIDFALGGGMHNVSPAFGPALMDDENEGDFHDRCQWLLARAASGHLRSPSLLPISNWPPSM